MAQCCSWCKMGFLGRGSTDQHGRVFCTPDHRAEYLMMNPSRCDNCNGVIHTSRLDTKAERFCSTSCALERQPCGCITDCLTPEDVGGLCHGNERRIERGQGLIRSHDAATASNHCAAA